MFLFWVFYGFCSKYFFFRFHFCSISILHFIFFFKMNLLFLFSSNRVRYFDTLFQSSIPILHFDPIFQFNKFLSIRYCVVHWSVYTIVLLHIVCPTARGLKRPLSRDFSYVLIDQSMSYGFSNYSIISQVFNKSIEFSIDFGLVVQSCNVVF